MNWCSQTNFDKCLGLQDNLQWSKNNNAAVYVDTGCETGKKWRLTWPFKNTLWKFAFCLYIS